MNDTVDSQRKVLQEHADLIYRVVGACDAPEFFPDLDKLLLQADQNGWTNLVAVIRRILDGERRPQLENLDREDKTIVAAILRGIQDKASLPDLASAIDPTVAGPALAALILAARGRDQQALNSLGVTETQMIQAGGDIARIGSVLRQLMAGDYRVNGLCSSMGPVGATVIMNIIKELERTESASVPDAAKAASVASVPESAHIPEPGRAHEQSRPAKFDEGGVDIEDGKYLRSVRDQYENYPYPKRDPNDERRTVYVTSTEHLGKISHYGFRGLRDLRKGSRFLVAGGGTGDAAIFLAEQLRGTDSEVFYLDLSSASMSIAKERAKVRQLDNICWLHNSLLELSRMDIGDFDYINCCGVLHHLEDPAEGLQALKSVLKEDGCMALMVYAEYGRTGVYHMQKLLRMFNEDAEDIEASLANARILLNNLPDTNWFKRDEARWKAEIDADGDVAIYDLFLHSQDRAYTVPQLYEWVEGSDLKIIKLTGFIGHSLKYDPCRYVNDDQLRQKLRLMPTRRQQAIAELLNGGIKTHTIYVSRNSDTIADADRLDMIPYYTFRFAPGEQVFQGLSRNPRKPLHLTFGKDVDDVFVEQGRYTRYLFRYIDGIRTLAEIFDCVQHDREFLGRDTPSLEDLSAEFKVISETLIGNELLLLRGGGIPPYSNPEDLIEQTLLRARRLG